MRRCLGQSPQKGNCLFTRFNAILLAAFAPCAVQPVKREGRLVTCMPEQTYTIETEQEEDGRWIAEVLDLPGVLAYGATEQEAIANAEALAFRVIADRIEETKIGTSRVSFASA